MDAHRREIARRIGGTGAAALPVLFLCVFLLYPLARIVWMGLGPLFLGGQGSLSQILTDINLGRLLAASAVQALLSTLLTLLAGLPAAYVFARFDFPGKAVMRTLLSIPFVLPTVVVSSAFVGLVGAGGVLEKAVALVTGNPDASASLVPGLSAVLLSHLFYNLAIVVRIVGGSWSSLDPKLGQAARTLGAGRVESFFRVTLRLLLPSIAAASILVFAFCFSSFGVVLVLGGPRTATIETEIYKQSVYMFNLPAAAFLSGIQLVVTVLIMYGYSRLQAGLSVVQNIRPEAHAAQKPTTAAHHALVILFGLVPTIGLTVPMLSLALGSFLTRNGIGLSYWKALFSNTGHSIFWTSPLPAALNSLLYSVETMILALTLGVPAAYVIARGQASRGGQRGGPRTSLRAFGAGALDLFFLLPLGTSAVTLGFGFIVSFGSPPLALRGSPLLIPLAHALVALPLVIRSLLAPLRAINPRLREAASLLGAAPGRVRREIDFPLLRRAFISAAAFAFTVSLGEFGATALLTRPDMVTLPVLIYSSLSRPGEMNQGQAMALSTILMLACGLGLAAIERFRTRSAEVF
jgi:thiamine transport system permease protein